MSAGDFDRIFAALSAGKVRYLVVGGVAVVLHGHPRFTADLDLVVALDPDNARAAIAALATLGYRPRAPVDGTRFADPTEVDLFVREPFPFEAASARAAIADLGDVQVPVACIGDLVALKRAAGRPRDLEDIRVLEAIARELKDD